MKKRLSDIILSAIALVAPIVSGLAQTYPPGLIDKTIAVVGGEMISIGALEGELLSMRARGMYTDANARCETLELMLDSKLLLMQARLDSLKVNQDMVTSTLNNQLDLYRQALGGDEAVEQYFGKTMYKLRQDLKSQLEDQSLTQQEQQKIAGGIPDLTPYDVKQYIAQTDSADLPVVPIRYRLSQICIYPDREAAKLAVRSRLLDLRERIINGEKFATLARIYSEDPGSARRGGELGMAPRTVYWGAFSDAAMSLRPGVISQIVETPDGFHIIETIEKKGDMFNARHILLRPQYTEEDREKAFKTLDSLRTEIQNGAVKFDLAARFYSEDPTTRTNGGQMADPHTGSSYFQIDELKPQDYQAIKDLKVGDMSQPVESVDNEGQRGNTVYKIVKVDEILPAHVATFDNDYDQLLGEARMKKAQAALDTFLDDKITTTYVVIDPIFKDCDFKREAWKKVVKASAEESK